jgi:hypothetical protein
VDPAEQFDADDHDGCRPEPFKAQHRTDAQFHTTVLLLNQVVRCCDERTFVSAGSWASVFFFRTARCDAA